MEGSVIGLQMLLIRSTLKVLKHPRNAIPSASLGAYVRSSSRLCTHAFTPFLWYLIISCLIYSMVRYMQMNGVGSCKTGNCYII